MPFFAAGVGVAWSSVAAAWLVEVESGEGWSRGVFFMFQKWRRREGVGGTESVALGEMNRKGELSSWSSSSVVVVVVAGCLAADSFFLSGVWMRESSVVFLTVFPLNRQGRKSLLFRDGLASLVLVLFLLLGSAAAAMVTEQFWILQPMLELVPET